MYTSPWKGKRLLFYTDDLLSKSGFSSKKWTAFSSFFLSLFYPFSDLTLATLPIDFLCFEFCIQKAMFFQSSVENWGLTLSFNKACFVFHYNQSIVGSVVECSPATRAARVRFPDDAVKILLHCVKVRVWFLQVYSFFFVKCDINARCNDLEHFNHSKFHESIVQW